MLVTAIDNLHYTLILMSACVGVLYYYDFGPHKRASKSRKK